MQYDAMQLDKASFVSKEMLPQQGVSNVRGDVKTEAWRHLPELSKLGALRFTGWGS